MDSLLSGILQRNGKREQITLLDIENIKACLSNDNQSLVDTLVNNQATLKKIKKDFCLRINIIEEKDAELLKDKNLRDDVVDGHKFDCSRPSKIFKQMISDSPFDMD